MITDWQWLIAWVDFTLESRSSSNKANGLLLGNNILWPRKEDKLFAPNFPFENNKYKWRLFNYVLTADMLRISFLFLISLFITYSEIYRKEPPKLLTTIFGCIKEIVVLWLAPTNIIYIHISSTYTKPYNVAPNFDIASWFSFR